MGTREYYFPLPHPAAFFSAFCRGKAGGSLPLPVRIFQILKPDFSLTRKCEYDTLKIEIDYFGRGVSKENGRIIP